MSNQDWSHQSDEMEDAVQSKIDKKDFTRLNELIQKTLNQGLDRFEQLLDGNDPQKVGDSAGEEKNGENWSTQNRGAEQSKESFSNWYNHGASFTGRGRERRQQSWRMWDSDHGRNWERGKQENQTSARQESWNSIKPKSKDPFVVYKDRYASPVSSRILGILLSIFGWTLALSCGIAEFVMLLVGATIFGGDFPIGMPLAMGIVLPFLIGGGWMANKGGKILGLAKRYKKYVGFLGDKEYCELQDLEYASGVSPKRLRKDLDKMLEKGWFLQGHLDQQETSLIVTEQAFAQYVEAQKEFRRREQETQQQAQKNSAANSSTVFGNAEGASGTGFEGVSGADRSGDDCTQEVPEEVRTVILEGRGYLKQIKESNDAIPGEEISAKISRLELVTERIFNRVEQHPDLVEELRRFMKYYLPTTVKLLKAYEELDKQEVQGPNILKSKGEIEDTLDTINRAFENLLDSFFEDTVVDISSDISVMQTLMAQEGLLGGNLKDRIKEKEKVLR